MSDSLAQVKAIDLPRQSCKDSEELCRNEEKADLQRLARVLNYIGHSVPPPTCYAASDLLQRSSSLKVLDLVFAGRCFAALQQLTPSITYHSQPHSIHYLPISTSLRLPLPLSRLPMRASAVPYTDRLDIYQVYLYQLPTAFNSSIGQVTCKTVYASYLWEQNSYPVLMLLIEFLRYSKQSTVYTILATHQTSNLLLTPLASMV